MVQVELREVSKRFGRVVAVDGVSFIAHEGELLALLGPSGCGKTTILRLIAGFEQPDTGDILFDGRSVLGLPPEARRVGMVFQNYALFPHMTVAGNIAYGLRFRRGIDRRRRVRELLELVGLEGLERRRPEELSAGQRQRVALARALAPEPRVLLLDEPLSALDAKLRERLRLEVKRLQRKLNITTIYVTHDQEEALAIADRVAVMSPGRIEQLGSPEEVYHKPKTEFVARFIGQGNLLAGEVIAVEPGRAAVRLRSGEVVWVQVATDSKPIQGEAVYLLIRPERLRLAAIAESEAESQAKGKGRGRENRLQGRLRDREFLGDASLLHIALLDGEEVRLKVLGEPQLQSGQKVGLHFSPEEAHLIPVSPTPEDTGGRGRCRSP